MGKELEKSVIVVVQSQSHVQLLEIPWTAARQASLSFTISQSLLKLTSIESVMPSSHLILCSPFSCCPQSFPASESFLMSQLFPLGGQSIGASTSASVLPVNIQGWFPLGLTGWISLQSKGLSRVFSNTTVQNHQFFGYISVSLFFFLSENKVWNFCKEWKTLITGRVPVYSC